MSENRKAVRLNASLEVSFRKLKALMRSGGRIKNISETGICMPLTQQFEVGSALEMEIRSMHFKSPVKAVVKVAWVKQTNNPKFPFEAGLAKHTRH